MAAIHLMLVGAAIQVRPFLSLFEDIAHTYWCPLATQAVSRPVGVAANALTRHYLSADDSVVVPDVAITLCDTLADMAVLALTSQQQEVTAASKSAFLPAPVTTVWVLCSPPPALLAAGNGFTDYALQHTLEQVLAVAPQNALIVLNGVLTASALNAILTDHPTKAVVALPQAVMHHPQYSVITPQTTLYIFGNTHSVSAFAQLKLTAALRVAQLQPVSAEQAAQLSIVQQLGCAQQQQQVLQHHVSQWQTKYNAVLTESVARNQRIGELKTQREALLQQIKVFETQQTAAQKVNATADHVLQQMQTGFAQQQQQWQAFAGVQHFMASGQLPLLYHNWPISPDVARFLLTLIAQERPTCIVEMGSGTSTIVLAKAMQTLHITPAKDKVPCVISLEHNEHYWHQTATLLASYQLTPWVLLQLAPLSPVTIAGNEYQYYNPAKIQHALQAVPTLPNSHTLVFVDGPPGRLGKLARLPALYVLLQMLPKQRFTLVVDDYQRADEQHMVALWQAHAVQAGFTCSVQTFATEKGLAVLRLHPI